jgi:heterodisulfide reductase subunit B
MKYGYYPGCSLERNASAYHKSAMAVAEPLGIEFAEVNDWNCCGATEYFSIAALPAYSLIARNLALAGQLEENGGQLIAPCSACFINLSKTDRYMQDSPELADNVNESLAAGGLHYDAGSLRVRHLLEIFVNDVGYDTIADHVTHPLYGLKIAPYYGCMIVRPGYDSFDDVEHPTSLDNLMRSLGAEVVDYALKTHCCGGHMTQISEPTAFEMIRRLLKNADDYGADAIVTLCPMCQLNLDAYQADVNRHFGTDYNIPILYFTQLVGLAFGFTPREMGIGKEFVSAIPALTKIQAEEPKSERKSRPDKNALPMPSTNGEGRP